VFHYLGNAETLLLSFNKTSPTKSEISNDKKMEICKHLYLAKRFLHNAEHLLEGTYGRPLSENEIAILLKIKNGNLTEIEIEGLKQEVLHTITTLKQKRAEWRNIETKTTKSVTFLNEWLLKIRKIFLNCQNI
jgi:hypothetical protein